MCSGPGDCEKTPGGMSGRVSVCVCQLTMQTIWNSRLYSVEPMLCGYHYIFKAQSLSVPRGMDPSPRDTHSSYSGPLSAVLRQVKGQTETQRGQWATEMAVTPTKSFDILFVFWLLPEWLSRADWQCVRTVDAEFYTVSVLLMQTSILCQYCWCRLLYRVSTVDADS